MTLKVATCRGCGKRLEQAGAWWVDEDEMAGCVKAPLETVGAGVPAAIVFHEPMPEGLRGAPQEVEAG